MISLFLFERELFTGKFGKAKCLTSASLSISLSLERWFGHAVVLHQVVSYSRSRCRYMMLSVLCLCPMCH